MQKWEEKHSERKKKWHKSERRKLKREGRRRDDKHLQMIIRMGKEAEKQLQEMYSVSVDTSNPEKGLADAEMWLSHWKARKARNKVTEKNYEEERKLLELEIVLWKRILRWRKKV